MDAYQDFCRDCGFWSLFDDLFALCLDLLIPDGNCGIDRVSNFFLNSIKSVYLSK